MKYDHLSSWLKLAMTLGWQDLRQSYRRTSLGQLWITLGMAFTVATIGLVFGLIFKAPLNEFVPYLTSGVIVWTYLSSLITENSLAIIAGEPLLKQIFMPLYVHVFRVTWRLLLTLAHNLVIFPAVVIIFRVQLNPAMLLFLPGLILGTAGLTALGLILAIVSARYRDIPPIVTSAMQVVFYVTPVMWLPSLLPPSTAHWLLGLNPMYHLLQIVRLPLLGQLPTFENWILALLFCLSTISIAWFVSIFAKRKVAYWV